MLSYRHSFHAGNFADVLKHSVLIHILEYLKTKQKPFCYVDTHSGAGLYSLNNEHAEKTREYLQGIGALWEEKNLPPGIEAYVNMIKEFNSQASLDHYPGSPLIAKHMLRKQDRLFLYELHSTDVQLLRAAMHQDKRVQIHQKDGFKYCLGLMPPIQRRGVVLIDPSYEVKTDYEQSVTSILQLYKRFSTGTYMLWYPVVERSRINEIEKKIQASPLKNVQLFELSQVSDSSGYGMTASGMIVINPPWTLKAEMQLTLPFLVKHLGLANQGSYRIEQFIDE